MENHAGRKVNQRAGAACFALASLASLQCRGDERMSPYQVCTWMREAAQTGDLVFRAEDGLISQMVMRAQGDYRYSHVGLVVINSGIPMVHHAEIDAESGAQGVVKQDLCFYLRRAQRAALMRPTSLSETERRAVANVVASLGYRPFNWRMLWQPKDGSVYCTQYVWQIFQRASPGRIAGLPVEPVLTVTKLLDTMSLAPVHVPEPLLLKATFGPVWKSTGRFSSPLH